MKNFVKQVLATIVAILLVLVGIVAVVAGIVASASRPTQPARGILTIDLGKELSDRGGATTLMQKAQGSDRFALPLHEAIAALKRAEKDDAIQGVLLHGGVTGGLSLLREFRNALLEFKKSKKPVTAYFPDYDDTTYYVASVASEIVIAPLGVVTLDGLKAEVLYFKDAIEKFGFDVQVSRVGKFKSAVEPFLASSMSDANREQLEAMLHDMSEMMIADEAASRGVEPTLLASVASKSPMLNADDAIAAKLIDRVEAFSQLSSTLRKIAGESKADGSFLQVSLGDYAKKERGHATDGPRVVAVAFAEGEIKDGEGEDGVFGDTLAKQLRQLVRDDNVKAIVLRVNSPGGSASASEVILDEVRRAKAAGKPVVVSMGDLAASGGYWISSLADAIVAQPSTLTGSIGVFGMFPNAEKVAAEMGVHREVVKTAPYADSSSLLRRKTPDELAQIQHVIDGIYDRFLDHVAEGRKKEKSAVHEIAQGRVWTGKRALELGLVDVLGGLDDAIALAASKASLGADFTVSYQAPEEGKLAKFLKAFDSDDAPLASVASLAGIPRVPRGFERPMQDVASVLELLADERVQARMGFLIDVR